MNFIWRAQEIWTVNSLSFAIFNEKLLNALFKLQFDLWTEHTNRNPLWIIIAIFDSTICWLLWVEYIRIINFLSYKVSFWTQEWMNQNWRTKDKIYDELRRNSKGNISTKFRVYKVSRIFEKILNISSIYYSVDEKSRKFRRKFIRIEGQKHCEKGRNNWESPRNFVIY